MDFHPFEAVALQSAGSFDSGGDVRGAFAVAAVGQVAVFDRRHFDMDVDPVHQRAGDARAVAVDVTGGAGAGVCRVAQIAAGAGVKGRDQHHPCRIGHRGQGAGDGYPAILQRLPEDLQDMLFELLL